MLETGQEEVCEDRADGYPPAPNRYIVLGGAAGRHARHPLQKMLQGLFPNNGIRDPIHWLETCSGLKIIARLNFCQLS